MLRVMVSTSRLPALSLIIKSALTCQRYKLRLVSNSYAMSCYRQHYSFHTSSESTTNMSEPEMVRRLMRSQRVWWWMGSLVIGSVGLIAFGPELKLGMSKHTAEVASRSLQDETLRGNTRELASQIVQTVLNDPKVLDQACGFLQRLVMMESTRKTLRALVIHTLDDPMIRSQAADLTKQTMAALLRDPNTLQHIVNLIRMTVLDPHAKEALLVLLEQIMQDKQTRGQLTQLLAHTLLQDIVKQNVVKTLSDSVHDVLSQGDVQNHAKEFVSGVVQDQTVQVQSGEAIWGTFMYALTPSWLSWIWENPNELANDSAPTSLSAEAAKVMVAATIVENELAKQKKKDQDDDTSSAEGTNDKPAMPTVPSHAYSAE